MEPVAEGQRRRYPLRERRAPRRFPDAEHVLLIDEGEPESFEEEKDDTHIRKWLSAMQNEMDSLHESHTHELVECQIPMYNGRIHSIIFECPSSGHLCK